MCARTFSTAKMLIVDGELEVATLAGPMRTHVLRPNGPPGVRYPGIVLRGHA